MSRRDNQFHNNDSRAWIEVMGRNLGGGVTLTIYAENGDERHGVRLCDHASVSLDATKLRGLAARLAREADALDGAAASSGERVDWQRVCDWMRDPQRKSADVAFTAGPERQLAYAFEDASGERVTDEDAERAHFVFNSAYHLDAAGHSPTRAEQVALRAVIQDAIRRRKSSGREAPSWGHQAPPTQDELRALIDSDPLMLAAYSVGKNESAAERSEANTPAPALPGPRCLPCGCVRESDSNDCLLVPGPGSEEANPYTVERAKLMLAIGKVQAFLDERCTGNTYCLMPHEEWTLIERTARAWLTFGPRDAGTPLSGHETSSAEHTCHPDPTKARYPCSVCGAPNGAERSMAKESSVGAPGSVGDEG